MNSPGGVGRPELCLVATDRLIYFPGVVIYAAGYAEGTLPAACTQPRGYLSAAGAVVAQDKDLSLPVLGRSRQSVRAKLTEHAHGGEHQTMILDAS